MTRTAKLAHGTLRLAMGPRIVLAILPDDDTLPVIWRYEWWQTAEAERHFETIKEVACVRESSRRAS